MVTISDVAREANVSPATVSRVINNSLVVSEAKRRRVLDVIDKLGYELPSHLSGVGKQVLVVSDVPSPEMNNQLYHSLSEMKYQMFMFYACESPSMQSDFLNFLKTMPLQQIAGVILCNFLRQIDEPLFKILDEFPVVQMGTNHPFTRTATIDHDSYQPAYQITKTLLEKGCKRIAVFSKDAQHPSNTLRAEDRNTIHGYMTAMFEAGMIPDPTLIIESDTTVEGCYEAVNNYLDIHTEPNIDAFICGIDIMAVGCLRALYEHGLEVPKDIMVASFSGSWNSRFSRPTVTSAESSSEDCAREAVKQLQILINDPEPTNRTVVLPSKLFLRESTGDYEEQTKSC